MQQGSDEWKDARLGKVTASRVSDVVARTKTGWAASRANLMATLICERLTGQSQDGYTNDAMRWGIETEPQARDAYAFQTDYDVEQVGLIDHPRIAMSGASPDGLIGTDGLVEIKCPNSATHIDFLLSGVIPDKYLKQMMWQMACTGREWVDYVSFDPRLPVDLRIKINRVHRVAKMIQDLENDVASFLSEVDMKIQSLMKLREAA